MNKVMINDTEYMHENDIGSLMEFFRKNSFYILVMYRNYKKILIEYRNSFYNKDMFRIIKINGSYYYDKDEIESFFNYLILHYDFIRFREENILKHYRSIKDFIYSTFTNYMSNKKVGVN